MWVEHIQSMLLQEAVARFDHPSVQELLSSLPATHAQTALVQAIQMGAVSMVAVFAAAGVRPDAAACTAMFDRLHALATAPVTSPQALASAHAMASTLHQAGADFSAHVEALAHEVPAWFAPIAALCAPSACPPTPWGPRRPPARRPR